LEFNAFFKNLRWIILSELFRKVIISKFERIPDGMYGIISVIAGGVGMILAYLFFPGYNFVERMISDLGAGPGGLFFNVGLITSGILGFPFVLSLNKSIKSAPIDERLKKTGFIIAILSCVSLSLIGCFPAIESNILLLALHGLCASTSWICGFLFCTLFSAVIIKNPDYSRFCAYLGFFVASIFLLTLITWIPVIEWFMLISFYLWVLAMAIHKMYINKMTQTIM
jgi:hypothetical membrane protein